MKTHGKRKIYRAWLKQQTQDGKMNRPDGVMVARAGLPDTSMKRDYHPQTGGTK